jgi:hypothetical protein
MPNTVNWVNPYAQREGQWLRGNLHTHTSPASPCGQVALARVLDQYTDAGYDFIAISDHMVYTPAADARMTLIPGIEWNSAAGEHTGLYGAVVQARPECCTTTGQDDVLQMAVEAGGLAILNHPNWQYRPHYHREELLAAGPYDGVEIFNGVIKRLEGYEIATDKWDYLLAQGRRVLGFASDDYHIESDIAQGWIMVRATERTPLAILQAIQSGNFYASSGVTITDIRREGDRVEIDTADADEIQILGEGGRLLHTVTARNAAFDLSDTDWSYIRFTAFGHGAAMAWTQPFFQNQGER